MNEKDLEYFKKLLLEKREEIFAHINDNLRVGGQLTSRTGRADDVDKASDELEHSLIYKLSERESSYLRKIDIKLKEIEEGTYGICKSCGKEIGIERLKVRPVADLCIECKIKEEQEEEALER